MSVDPEVVKRRQIVSVDPEVVKRGRAGSVSVSVSGP